LIEILDGPNKLDKIFWHKSASHLWIQSPSSLHALLKIRLHSSEIIYIDRVIAFRLLKTVSVISKFNSITGLLRSERAIKISIRIESSQMLRMSDIVIIRSVS